jgi:hypothetical protein
MSLHSVSLMVVAPLVLTVGAVILLTPRDILRQPVMPVAEQRPAPVYTEPAEKPPEVAIVEFDSQELRPPTLIVVASAPSAELVTGSTGQLPTADRRYITARALNVRTGPSVRDELIASLPFGTPVSVLDTSGTWALIEADGVNGWLSANFLSESDPSTE